MSDAFKENASRLRERWDQLPGQRQKTLVLLALISVVTALGILAWAFQPRYSRLYSQLSVEDAGAIVERLKSEKIPYRISDGGSAIEVPSEQVHELKMKMATEGLPRSSGPGWELFDKTPFGMTEFTQKLNFQRALQAELAKTIMQLSQVEQARVHLTIPEPSLYQEDAEEPTASVVLHLSGTKPLAKNEIKGIVHLVSSAVVGLKPENVTLIDARGNILSTEEVMADEDPDATPDQTETQLKLQAQIERKVQREIQSMLDKALGPEQAVVRVRAQMDFTRRESNTETYTPAVQGQDAKGVLNEQHTVEENYSGRRNAGQVPGAASNIQGMLPGMVGYRAEDTSPGAGYVRRETTARYHVSKKVERLVSHPGETIRMSVAILVNGPIDEAKREALRDAATAAAGLDIARGDQISVVGIAFDTKAAEEEKKQLAAMERKQMIGTILRYVALFGLMIFALLVVRMATRKPSPVSVTGMLPAPSEEPPALESAPTVGQLLDQVEESPATPEEAVEPEPEPEAEPEEPEETERPPEILPTISPTEERLRRLAAEDPEFVARLLRSWLINQGKR